MRELPPPPPPPDPPPQAGMRNIISSIMKPDRVRRCPDRGNPFGRMRFEKILDIGGIIRGEAFILPNYLCPISPSY